MFTFHMNMHIDISKHTEKTYNYTQFKNDGRDQGQGGGVWPWISYPDLKDKSVSGP